MRFGIAVIALSLCACPRLNTTDGALFACDEDGRCDPGHRCLTVYAGETPHSDDVRLCLPERCDPAAPNACGPRECFVDHCGCLGDQDCPSGVCEAESGRCLGREPDGGCPDSGRPLPKVRITEFTPPRAPNCALIRIKYETEGFQGIANGCDGGAACGAVRILLTSSDASLPGAGPEGTLLGKPILGHSDTASGTIDLDLRDCSPPPAAGYYTIGVYPSELLDGGLAFIDDCAKSGYVSAFHSFPIPPTLLPEPQPDASFLTRAPTSADRRFRVKYAFSHFDGYAGCGADAGRHCGRAFLYLKGGEGWINCQPDGGLAGPGPGQAGFLAYSDEPAGELEGNLDHCPGLRPSSDAGDYSATVHLVGYGPGSFHDLIESCSLDGDGYIGVGVPLTVPDP